MPSEACGGVDEWGWVVDGERRGFLSGMQSVKIQMNIMRKMISASSTFSSPILDTRASVCACVCMGKCLCVCALF